MCVVGVLDLDREINEFLSGWRICVAKASTSRSYWWPPRSIPATIRRSWPRWHAEVARQSPPPRARAWPAKLAPPATWSVRPCDWRASKRSSTLPSVPPSRTSTAPDSSTTPGERTSNRATFFSSTWRVSINLFFTAVCSLI